MPKNSAEPHLLTLKDAGEILGVHPRFIRRRIAEGKLTGYRLGERAFRVDRAELLAYLETTATTRFGGGAA